MSALNASLSNAAHAPRIPAVIMAGAAVNALAVNVMASLGPGATLSLSLGINPFQLVAVAVAAKLSFGEGVTRPHSPWIDAITLGLLLVPSSAVAWLALALYAGIQAQQTTGERRTGALVFLALALASLWSSILLKWIAMPVTTAETFVLAEILRLFRPEFVQHANVVGDPAGHNLILMTRCTTADALPHAAVALAAVAVLLGHTTRRRLLQAGLVLAAVYTVGNLVRLAAMAWSTESYALVHGPVGANLFDLFQVAAVLALGNWASRP